MAQKSFEKQLDDAVEELYKDYKKAIKKAAKEATEKAKNDIYIKSLSCLVNYYADYNPTSYDRTYSLMNCFVPYANEIKEMKDEYICSAGVEYNPSLLDGVYYGSKNYSPTDSEWIVDNYLAGIHPRTDGSTITGYGDYDNQKYQGEFIPHSEMENYINSYNTTFEHNYRRSLAKQVLAITIK